MSINGGSKHTPVQKKAPYSTKARRAAAVAATALPPGAAAASAAAAAAKKVHFEMYVVRAWDMFKDPEQRPRLLALVDAAFDLSRFRAVRAQNRKIEVEAAAYQLAARTAELEKLARKAAERAAQTKRNWQRRGDYIDNAEGLRAILEMEHDTPRHAAIVKQIDIRKYAFGFDVSGKQFVKGLPHDKLIAALVSNLEAERRQGVPTTMPVVELGRVGAMVLPGPATTASLAAAAEFDTQARTAYDQRKAYFERTDGQKRRAPSAAAEPAAQRVKRTDRKKTAVASASLQHHRTPPADKVRHRSPCTDEPSGAAVLPCADPFCGPGAHSKCPATRHISVGSHRAKRTKVARTGLGDYERPRAP